MPTLSKTKAKATATQAKGKVKSAAGSATGNSRLKASGKKDVAVGKAQSKFAGASDGVKHAARRIAGKD